MVDYYEYSHLFLENDTKKDFIITDGIVSIAGGSFVYSDYTYLITNDDLKGVPKIHEILCDEDDLQFGQSNSNWIEFSVASDMTALLNKTVRVYVYLNEIKESILLIGKYKVTQDKPTADRNYRDIVAYDDLYFIKKADVTDWYKSVLPNDTSELSLKDFRRLFCTNFGLYDATDSDDMPNDGMSVKKTVDTESSVLLGEAVLNAICSVNGGFGKINRMGFFNCLCLKQSIIGLYPSPMLYPAEDLYPREEKTTMIDTSVYIPPLEYEDYTTQSISRVQIREDDDDIGVTVGEEGNDFVLEGNFLLFGKSAEELHTIAENLLNRISSICYTPFHVEAFGYPIFEVGDPVRLRTNTARINTYILNRTLTGTQNLEDEYEARGNKYREENVTDLSTDIAKLKSRTLKIRTDVDNFSVELNDFENDTNTKFWLTSYEIGLKVGYGEIINSINLSSEGLKINANKININGITTINNYFEIGIDGKMTCRDADIEYATIKECDFSSGNVVIDDNETVISFGSYDVLRCDDSSVTMFDNGLKIGYDANESDYLVIDGTSSRMFSNVAVNGYKVHINYSGYDTRVYHCTRIFYGTDTYEAYIGLNSNTVSLRADNVVLGLDSGANVSIPGTLMYMKPVWQTITIGEGQTVTVLTGI